MTTHFLVLSIAFLMVAALPAVGQEGGAARELPAGAEDAQAALQASPRHGEWVDVPVEGGTPVRSFIVYPERSDKAPVVIVIHEIFGLTDWVRAVADQLAAEGFIAIAPDLLSGKGENGGGTESFSGDAVRAAVRGLETDEVVQRLDAVRDYATALPAATDKFAAIGFCWGGSTSFTYATRQPELDAAIVYYGTGPTDPAAVAKIQTPVLGIYGGDDARVTSTVEGTTALMRDAGKAYDTHVYDGAGHGFLRQQSGREANATAAAQAWRETVGFLREHLR